MNVYYVVGPRIHNLLKGAGLDGACKTMDEANAAIKFIGVGEVVKGTYDEYKAYRESRKLFMLKMKGSIQYFDNKVDAKALRDSLGGPEKGYYVQKGPAHMGKHGMGRVPRMRRQPK